MIGALHLSDPISRISFDKEIVMNLILVSLVCQYSEYEIPE
jgi:hypothetical protein